MSTLIEWQSAWIAKKRLPIIAAIYPQPQGFAERCQGGIDIRFTVCALTC